MPYQRSCFSFGGTTCMAGDIIVNNIPSKCLLYVFILHESVNVSHQNKLL